MKYKELGRTGVLLGWCISHEGVVAISKSDSADHIRDSCASASKLSDVDADLLEPRLDFEVEDVSKLKYGASRAIACRHLGGNCEFRNELER
jgi:diketogulonate reductase-like aldo/keto reductase